MAENLVGRKFGILTVISEEDRTASHDSRWLCKCDCGNYKILHSTYLKKHDFVSCGCLASSLISKSKFTHKDIHSKEYRAWSHMKSRCYNELVPRYKNYGGRGIKVCKEWVSSYENFLEDMGRCPHKDWTLDRINPDGNYTKDNCRWTTQLIQANNKTDNHYLTHGDTKMSLADWARHLNMTRSALSRLLNVHGFTIGEILEGKRGVEWQKKITIKGLTLNVNQWAKKLNTTPSSFNRKEFKNLSKEKVIELFYERGIVDNSKR